MVTHELRTPIFIIKEGIDQVTEGMHGDLKEEQKKILGMAGGNAKRLALIVNDLLDISKIEAGKFDIKKKDDDIVAAVNEIVHGFESVAKEKRLELRKSYPSKETRLSFDKLRIEQVLTNLLSNAIKFTAKGFVEVGLADKGDMIELYVADSGHGMTKEEMPKLFNKFEQLGHGAEGGEKGTGLGLAITKGIVELHGGKIRVESIAGKGSKFMFTLPRS
ncbi:MAG: hypothetical protein COX62_03150 [Deltaproteobacteria bacterium CG_4_10_14_0_2_um_filter_43_8]|nr:MAG: hypothetical protein COV46_04365 [Deltaproteobacteria bacterium CG11_big_fil_rev_8_21_14_0_20_49_13]PJA21149.1 MAG: hypothetical protein COX62_03150 [Deltaproteobacteria bacterium CG_4_10_14_0_2_um_filter_43_8]